MSIEPSRPKYAEIVEAIRQRIERRAYRIGDLLPSEAQLVAEFGVSRSTVVKALAYLRQQGLIQGVQGKGRLVIRERLSDETPPSERIRRLLRPATFGEVTSLGVRLEQPVGQLRTALALADDGWVRARLELVTLAGGGPSVFSTTYVPTDLAWVDEPLGLPAGGRRVREWLGARRSTREDVERLCLPRPQCLVTTLLVVLGDDDRPLFAVDAVFAPHADELTEVYLLP